MTWRLPHSRVRALVTLLATLIASALTVACKSKPPPIVDGESDAAGVVTDEARAYARSVYALRCAACHGATGLGARESGAGIPLPNFRDIAWQNGITDSAIERIVALGGRGTGKNAIMPANPDLAASRESLAAMRAHLRSFGAR
jgi:mono/diheme cytochrome c family protein